MPNPTLGGAKGRNKPEVKGSGTWPGAGGSVVWLAWSGSWADGHFETVILIHRKKKMVHYMLAMRIYGLVDCGSCIIELGAVPDALRKIGIF